MSSGTSVIPPGFSKCSGCGRLIGGNAACPYCTPPPPSNVAGPGMSADAQWDIVIRGLRRRNRTDEQIAYCEEALAALRERQQRQDEEIERLRFRMECADTPLMRDVLARVQQLEDALRRIKPLVDPDREPFDPDKRKQILAMRDVASQAWLIAADALAEDARAALGAESDTEALNDRVR